MLGLFTLFLVQSRRVAPGNLGENFSRAFLGARG
jgi:hypothetical protein